MTVIILFRFKYSKRKYKNSDEKHRNLLLNLEFNELCNKDYKMCNIGALVSV